MNDDKGPILYHVISPSLVTRYVHEQAVVGETLSLVNMWGYRGGMPKLGKYGYHAEERALAALLTTMHLSRAFRLTGVRVWGNTDRRDVLHAGSHTVCGENRELVWALTVEETRWVCLRFLAWQTKQIVYPRTPERTHEQMAIRVAALTALQGIERNDEENKDELFRELRKAHSQIEGDSDGEISSVLMLIRSVYDTRQMYAISMSDAWGDRISDVMWYSVYSRTWRTASDARNDAEAPAHQVLEALIAKALEARGS